MMSRDNYQINITMALIKPRLNDYYNLPFTQEEVDFAIPCLDEDIPLYLDPFLLCKLLSIITNVDETVVEETYRLSKAIAVIMEFWENEEISKILGGAKRLATDQEFQERQTTG